MYVGFLILTVFSVTLVLKYFRGYGLWFLALSFSVFVVHFN